MADFLTTLALDMGLPERLPKTTRELLENMFKNLGFREATEACVSPSLQELERYLYPQNLAELWMVTPDGCPYGECHRRRDYLEIATLALILGLPLNCQIVKALFEMKQMGHEVPESAQVETYLKNRADMEEDPDGYCGKERVPTPFKGRIPVVPCQQGMTMTCALCQEDPNPGEAIFQMPCCLSVFHTTPCHENGNILKWFEDHNSCPGCNKSLEETFKRRHEEEESTKSSNPAKRARR